MDSERPGQLDCGGEKLVDLGHRLSGRKEGRHAEGLRALDLVRVGEDVEVAVDTLVGVGGEERKVVLDNGPEVVVNAIPLGALREISGRRVEGEVGDGDRHVGVRLDGGGDHHAVGRASAATQSPVEVGIVGGVGRHEAAIGKDNFECKHLVGCHAVNAAEWRVPPALDVPSAPADGLKRQAAVKGEKSVRI